ncbi:MAG: extracellular solute-binding protein [Victivallaceae bacterium]|nr:extracellular solute-binding protein [Victivallaceae bacterium]
MNRPVVICVVALAALIGVPFALRPKPEVKAVDSGSDVVVVLTPHNKTVRDEYERAFDSWYRRRHGRSVTVDFRTVGGTNEMYRMVADRYAAVFRRKYEATGRKWTDEIAYGFCNPASDGPGTPEDVREARRMFLESDVSVGIDVIAGGGDFEQRRSASRGYAVNGGAAARHPEYFKDAVIPENFGGCHLYDARNGGYYGVTLTTFGMCCNLRRLAEEDVELPSSWEELGDPCFFGLLALANPTKSGSVNKCFENMIQSKMGRAATPDGGWNDGINLVKRAFANARIVTDAADTVVHLVSAGEVAAGVAIDTYAIGEMLYFRDLSGDGTDRVAYVAPRHGTAVSCDPVQILRGAPHRKVAEEFVDFLLSDEGQRLHAYRPRTPGGPVKHSISSAPIRRDVYDDGYAKYSFSPGHNPYLAGSDFTYRPEYTERYFRMIGQLVKYTMIEPHDELVAAWHEIIKAGGPERVPEAMACFNRLPFGYSGAAEALKSISPGGGRSNADVAAVYREWTDFARNSYREAAQLAAKGR